jgi:hypothetical protein
MPFNFRDVFRIGSLPFSVGKRGLTSGGVGRLQR